MASTGRGRSSKQGNGCPSLSEQGHQQIIDYLRLAEESRYVEIREAAIRLAEQTSKYHHKQSARVSPNLILWIYLILGIAVTAANWLAYSHYPERLAFEVSSISALVYLAFVGTTLFLAGRLSQANLMKILGWLRSHFKAWGSGRDKMPDDQKLG